jgi:hypothetical protein
MTLTEPRGASLAAFLQGDVDAKAFHHVDHVRVAFEILGRHDFIEAAAAYSAGLRRIAGGAYHQTITVAFLSLISERREAGPCADFETFCRMNPDLLNKAVLERWYDPRTLSSPVARRTFVLPRPRT